MPTEYRGHQTLGYTHELLDPCPVVGGEPIERMWSNHDKTPKFNNECPNCAPENNMSLGERLAELERSRCQ